MRSTRPVSKLSNSRYTPIRKQTSVELSNYVISKFKFHSTATNRDFLKYYSRGYRSSKKGGKKIARTFCARKVNFHTMAHRSQNFQKETYYCTCPVGIRIAQRDTNSFEYILTNSRDRPSNTSNFEATR